MQPKKIAFIVVLYTAIECFGMGSSKGVPPLDDINTQISPEIKQIIASENDADENRQANYLNYIQYSTSKIIKSRSKVAIDAERFDIFNNIKNENLRHDDLIEAYDNLLNTLANLEMSKQNRDLLELDIKNRRNNAIWQAASSLGNSVIAAGGWQAASNLGNRAIATGSAGAATGGIGAAVALAGIIVNTGINYVRTQNEISNDSLKKNLEINYSEEEALNRQQANLFTAQAKVFKDKEHNKEISLIRQDPMKLFTDLLVKYDQKNFDEQNQDFFIAELSDYEKKTWALFQPYQEFFVKLYSDKYIKTWNACIAEGRSEQQCMNNIDHAALDSAIMHYNNLRFICKNTRLNIFTEQNPILKNSSKKMLHSLLTQSNKYAKMIENTISELERSVVKENSMELSDSRYLIYTAYLSLGKIDEAKDVFSKLEKTGTVKKTDRMYYTHHCSIIKEKNDFCKNSAKMWMLLDNIGGEEYRNYEDYECLEISRDFQVKEQSEEKKNSSSKIINKDNVGFGNKIMYYAGKGGKLVKDGATFVVNKIQAIAKDVYDDVVDTPEKECFAEIDRIKEQKDNPQKIYFGDEGQVFLNTFYEIDNPMYFFRGHKKIDDEKLKAYVFVNQNNVVFDSLGFKF